MTAPEDIIQAMRTTKVSEVLKRLQKLHGIAMRFPKSPSAEFYRQFAKVFLLGD